MGNVSVEHAFSLETYCTRGQGPVFISLLLLNTTLHAIHDKKTEQLCVSTRVELLTVGSKFRKQYVLTVHNQHNNLRFP